MCIGVLGSTVYINRVPFLLMAVLTQDSIGMGRIRSPHCFDLRGEKKGPYSS